MRPFRRRSPLALGLAIGLGLVALVLASAWYLLGEERRTGRQSGQWSRR